MSNEHQGGFRVTWQGPLTLAPGSPANITLMSDLHVGGASTDYEAIAKELKHAKDNDHRIAINGDVFDLILPADTKRYLPSALHPRLQGCDDLVNKAVDWAYELLSPYAEHLDLIGVGNHEQALLKKGSLDPVLLLVDRLNEHLSRKNSYHTISYGGYTGLLCYQLRGPLGLAPGSPLVIYYHHGYGKGGSLSSSSSQYNQLQFVEGAHVYWLGHFHSRLNAHVVKLAPPKWPHTRPAYRDVRFVRTGAYIDSYKPESTTSINKVGRKSSYASDAGLPPHGKGGAVLTFSLPSPGHELVTQVTQ